MKNLFSKYKKEVALTSIVLVLAFFIQLFINLYIISNPLLDDITISNPDILITLFSFAGISIAIYAIFSWRKVKPQTKISNEDFYSLAKGNWQIFISLIKSFGLILISIVILANISDNLIKTPNTWRDNAKLAAHIYPTQKTIIDSFPQNKRKGYAECSDLYQMYLHSKKDLEQRKQNQVKLENSIAYLILKAFDSEENFSNNFDFFNSERQVSENRINVDITDYISFNWNKYNIDKVKDKIGAPLFHKVVEMIPEMHFTEIENNPIYRYGIAERPQNIASINVYDIYKVFNILGSKPKNDQQSLYSLTVNKPMLRDELAENFLTYESYQNEVKHQKDLFNSIQNKVKYYNSLNTIHLIKTYFKMVFLNLIINATFIFSLIPLSILLYLFTRLFIYVCKNIICYFNWCIKTIKNDDN